MSTSAPSDHGDLPGDPPVDPCSIFLDPLLGSGSFISSPTPVNGENLDNDVKRRPILSGCGVSASADSVDSGMSIGMDHSQHMPENTAHPAESKTRKRAAPGDDWLPPDWRVEEKVRTSGATAGSVDKYYYEPITGRRFRSKTEVLYYLEHGTLKKTPKKSDCTIGQSDRSEGEGSSRKKKSSKKAKEAPLNFDFQNAPEKISWVLTDDKKNSCWTAFMENGDSVAEAVTRDWDRAFVMVTTTSVSSQTPSS